MGMWLEKEHLLMMSLVYLSLHVSFLSQKLIVLDQVLLQHPTGRPRVLHLIQQPDPLHRGAPSQRHITGHWKSRWEKKQVIKKDQVICPRKKEPDYHVWILDFAVNAHPDLPPACSELVLTHSSGEHPHLPSICTPNKIRRGNVIFFLYCRNNMAESLHCWDNSPESYEPPSFHPVRRRCSKPGPDKQRMIVIYEQCWDKRQKLLNMIFSFV